MLYIRGIIKIMKFLCFYMILHFSKSNSQWNQIFKIIGISGKCGKRLIFADYMINWKTNKILSKIYITWSIRKCEN